LSEWAELPVLRADSGRTPPPPPPTPAEGVAGTGAHPPGPARPRGTGRPVGLDAEYVGGIKKREWGRFRLPMHCIATAPQQWFPYH